MGSASCPAPLTSTGALPSSHLHTNELRAGVKSPGDETCQCCLAQHLGLTRSDAWQHTTACSRGAEGLLLASPGWCSCGGVSAQPRLLRALPPHGAAPSSSCATRSGASPNPRAQLAPALPQALRPAPVPEHPRRHLRSTPVPLSAARHAVPCMPRSCPRLLHWSPPLSCFQRGDKAPVQLVQVLHLQHWCPCPTAPCSPEMGLQHPSALHLQDLRARADALRQRGRHRGRACSAARQAATRPAMMSGCAAAAGASWRVSIEQDRPLRLQMAETSALTLSAVASRTASERHLWAAHLDNGRQAPGGGCGFCLITSPVTFSLPLEVSHVHSHV